MSFDRHRAQIRAEGWPFWGEKKLIGFTLDDVQAKDLSGDLRQDAVDLYFKGSLSACEAIEAVSRKHYSWSTVKLYYAVFYFLRATLASRQIAILKHRSFVYVKAFLDEEFHNSGSKTGSTHEAVLTIASQMFKNTDLLLSNSIDGDNPYFWLKEQRERVNYRERCFHEPEVPDLWHEIEQRGDLGILLNIYRSDSKAIYCFQKEHACLALPLKRWALTKNDLINAGISTILSEKQIKTLAALFTKRTKVDLFALLPDYDGA